MLSARCGFSFTLIKAQINAGQTHCDTCQSQTVYIMAAVVFNQLVPLQYFSVSTVFLKSLRTHLGLFTQVVVRRLSQEIITVAPAAL